MNKIRTFARAHLDELLYKVTWPSLDELQASTVTVLIASLILAVVIALMDTAFNNAFQFIYSLFL